MSFKTVDKLESQPSFLAIYNQEEYTVLPYSTSGDNANFGMYATMGQLKETNYGLTVRSLFWSLKVVGKDLSGSNFETWIQLKNFDEATAISDSNWWDVMTTWACNTGDSYTCSRTKDTYQSGGLDLLNSSGNWGKNNAGTNYQVGSGTDNYFFAEYPYVTKASTAKVEMGFVRPLNPNVSVKNIPRQLFVGDTVTFKTGFKRFVGTRAAAGVFSVKTATASTYTTTEQQVFTYTIADAALALACSTAVLAYSAASMSF